MLVMCFTISKQEIFLKNLIAIVLLLPLISLLLDIYKSWNDFNFFIIITLYLPGFFIIHFINNLIAILEINSIELQKQRIKENKTKQDFPQQQKKHYHTIFEAICLINNHHGLSFFNYVLLTTLMALFFCYKHFLNLIKFFKREEDSIQPNCFAPDFWTITLTIQLFRFIKICHHLQKQSRTIKNLIMDDLILWQINYETIEITAWDFFKIGNHIFISVSMIDGFSSLLFSVCFIILDCWDDCYTRFSALSDGGAKTLIDTMMGVMANTFIYKY